MVPPVVTVMALVGPVRGVNQLHHPARQHQHYHPTRSVLGSRFFSGSQGQGGSRHQSSPTGLKVRESESALPLVSCVIISWCNVPSANVTATASIPLHVFRCPRVRLNSSHEDPTNHVESTADSHATPGNGSPGDAMIGLECCA